MSDLVLDAAQSQARIHTFAEGLLARLAHDLELVCVGLEGSASPSLNGAPSGTARVEVPLRGMSVAGVIAKGGRLDDRVLSAGERRDIVAKMQSDVFHAGPDGVVRIEVHLDGPDARVRIALPNGKAVETSVRPDVTAEGRALRAKGTLEVSLAAIGSDAIKGPMGAFRVKDRVRVSFDVVFVPLA